MERTLTITSTPPGAVVYLNDREVGRTPVTRDFLWYGVYNVTLRRDGCEALKTTQNVFCPFYEIVPLDLLTEAMPFVILHDDQKFHYTLKPLDQPSQEALVARALEMKGQLEPGRKPPATQPVKKAKPAAR